MSNTKKYDLICILGPTASGKTSLAVNLANEIDSEIISADSRQVYKGMDIGTGKDLEEYTINNKKIPYHLIDIVEAGDKYNVFRFQSDFLDAYNLIKSKNKTPVLCGGTGMYIEAVTKGYKLIQVPNNEQLRKKLESKSLDELQEILSSYKKLHNTSDTDTVKRAVRAIEIAEYYKNNPETDSYYPKINTLFIGVKIERDLRRKRITERLKQRLQNGMIEEVESLLNNGVPYETLIYYGLEYKYIAQYLKGELSKAQMVNSLQTAIHQFAKRQMTWFRKMERQGIKIHWVDFNLPMEDKISFVKKHLEL